MPKIYDNIENYLKEGLNKTLENANRADFCIGYFNLRGWKQLYQHIEQLPGDYLSKESGSSNKYYCRILIGMQRQPIQLLEEIFSTNNQNIIDNARAHEFKKKIAQEDEQMYVNKLLRGEIKK